MGKNDKRWNAARAQTTCFEALADAVGAPQAGQASLLHSSLTTHTHTLPYLIKKR